MKISSFKKLIFLFGVFNFCISALGFCAQPDKLIVFDSAACKKCNEIKSGVLPEIEKEFAGRILLEQRDIADVDNYKLLLGLKERYKIEMDNALPVFFLQGHFLSAQKLITRDSLRSFIAQALNNPLVKEEPLKIDLVNYFKRFAPLAVVGAGLIDGVNPCAFTVIVFFISFLALQGYCRKEVLLVGSFFIFAVFLTYILIGLGIFAFLYQLGAFWRISRIVNFSVGIFSITLGFLCLYDFFKVRSTQNPRDSFLQLPESLKYRIHKIIGWQYRKPKLQEGEVFKKSIFALIISALISGFLVSILEAVCTGQVYLPAITFVLKTTPFKLRALGYLLLYNFMFIAPLVIIFIFGLLGVTSEGFAKILKKHILSVKILMAVLFFMLGIFLVGRF